MYNNLPKNGGMEDKRSILPYKNPMPVGPHICKTGSVTCYTGLDSGRVTIQK